MRPFIPAVSRKSILTAVFVFGLAASVAAAPQRGGGGRSGGGSHSSSGHAVHSGPRGHIGGGPHGSVGGPRGPVHGRPGRVIIRGGVFDPFWGPYYPYGYGYGYAYGYGYPYGYVEAYGPSEYSQTPTGDVRTEVTPKEAEVYVDGYYAGVADNFDGVFQRLHTSPGGHTITLRLDGYRTVTQNVYVRPESTLKLKETMEKLAPGEVSESVPEPAMPTGSPERVAPTSDAGSPPQR